MACQSLPPRTRDAIPTLPSLLPTVPRTNYSCHSSKFSHQFSCLMSSMSVPLCNLTACPAGSGACQFSCACLTCYRYLRVILRHCRCALGHLNAPFACALSPYATSILSNCCWHTLA